MCGSLHGCSGTIDIEDEGGAPFTRPTLNFTGAGVTATDDPANDRVNVAIPGASGGHTIEDEGSPLPAETKLNFIGAGVTATDNAGTGATDVTIPGAGGAAAGRLVFIIDGQGSAITPGIKGDIYVKSAVTINRVTLLADAAGSIVVDIWRDLFANYPPTVADTITAAAPPTLTAADHSKDSTLTGWTVAIPADSTLRFNVNSATTIKRVTITLDVT